MVRMKVGWVGLLALLPAVLGRWLPVRESPPEDCQFVMQCDTALFGFNDKTIRGISSEACKQACLDEEEFVCKSVDYVRDSESCYLSQENAATQAVHIGPHSGSDHYSYLCGDEQLASVAEVPGTNCGFAKQCHTALFGFNTLTIEGVTVESCMESCVEETSFDCLSFDYSVDSRICYMSEEDSTTQAVHMGPHFGADFYQKVCGREPEPEPAVEVVPVEEMPVEEVPVEEIPVEEVEHVEVEEVEQVEVEEVEQVEEVEEEAAQEVPWK